MLTRESLTRLDRIITTVVASEQLVHNYPVDAKRNNSQFVYCITSEVVFGVHDIARPRKSRCYRTRIIWVELICVDRLSQVILDKTVRDY